MLWRRVPLMLKGSPGSTVRRIVIDGRVVVTLHRRKLAGLWRVQITSAALKLNAAQREEVAADIRDVFPLLTHDQRYSLIFGE